MGMYDTFINEEGTLHVQLKNGECLMNEYRVGDSVLLADAFYYGLEGVVVVRGGRVESVTRVAPDNTDLGKKLPCLTKWGDLFDPTRQTIEGLNPIAEAVQTFLDGEE